MSLPDSNDYGALGGEIRDYSPVEDPTTDLSAEASNEMRADVAAMTRMIPRAMVEFTVTGTTVSLVDHNAVWGSGVSVAPTLAYLGAGLYSVTWPSTVTDARGISRSLNLKRGLANSQPTSNLFIAQAERLTPNSFKVTVLSVVDTVAEDTSGPVQLWVW